MTDGASLGIPRSQRVDSLHQPCNRSSGATVSHIKRSRAQRVPVCCDNFLYQRLQGHAFGAPGRLAPAGLVQWARRHAGMRWTIRGVPRRRRPGLRGVSPLWGGSFARCLSVGDARRGPLPQRRYPASVPGVATRRHAFGGRACKSGRAVLPRRASCRRESSQSRARPTAASLRFRSGQTLDCELPRQDRHLPGGRGRSDAAGPWPALAARAEPSLFRLSAIAC
jgi:hypothetical protein